MINFIIFTKDGQSSMYCSDQKFEVFFRLYEEYLLVKLTIDDIKERLLTTDHGSFSFNTFAMTILPTKKLKVEYLYDFEGSNFYTFEISFNLLKKIIDIKRLQWH
jgi:hypothetical protein